MCYLLPHASKFHNLYKLEKKFLKILSIITIKEEKKTVNMNSHIYAKK